MNYMERQQLFEILDDTDKKMILEEMNSSERMTLINALPESEQSRWLDTYTDSGVEIMSEKDEAIGDTGAMEVSGSPLSDIEKSGALVSRGLIFHQR